MMAGSDQVMAAQIDHLRSSPADVRILPFRAGMTPHRSAWTMFTLDDEEHPTVVYEPGAGASRYLDKPQDWAEYEFLWSIVAGRAVPIADWPT